MMVRSIATTSDPHGGSVPDDFKYRAFLSYSHADSGAAKRVHGSLEGFPIDKDLVGRVTPTGAVPGTLRPIFRDRQDFDAGASLGDKTIGALDDSAALILLASPHSARSHYVNEEVRLFRSRHPDRPVIPLIVEGKPGDPQDECFAPAVRFAVASDGAITESPDDVLAADLREQGDGFELAIAKVVARLIGLPPDDVYRRAERERRRQGRIRNTVAAVIAALAITGGVFFWQSHQQRATLAEVAALVDRYSLVNSAQARVPGARHSLAQAITAIAEGAATDPRYAEALELLKAGKAAEAEPLLKAVADDKASRAEKDAKDAAAAYRTLASIAALSDTARAREYYAEAARLDPSDLEGMYRNGSFQKLAGHLDAAQAAFARVIAAAKPGVDDLQFVRAKNGIGDIEMLRGNLGAALADYQAAATFAERLVKSDPGNADLQRVLGISYVNIGYVQLAQGNLPAALASYQAALAIMDGLAKADPGNALAQRGLASSYSGIARVQLEQGDLPAALASWQAAIAIWDRLVTAVPGNVDLQNALADSYMRVGQVQLAQGSLPAALASYQAGEAITDRLAKADPGNADLQNGLVIAYFGIGDVQVVQGNLPAALATYQTAWAIIDRLAKSDPGAFEWQLNLSVAYSKLGDVFTKQSNREGALQNYRPALAIMERLAAADATDMRLRADIIEFNYDLAVNGDNSADRFAFVAAGLRKLKSERELTSEQAGWLAEAEKRLAEVQRP